MQGFEDMISLRLFVDMRESTAARKYHGPKVEALRKRGAPLKVSAITMVSSIDC